MTGRGPNSGWSRSTWSWAPSLISSRSGRRETEYLLMPCRCLDPGFLRNSDLDLDLGFFNTQTQTTFGDVAKGYLLTGVTGTLWIALHAESLYSMQRRSCFAHKLEFQKWRLGLKIL
jgi:hypothetical protein